MNAENKMSALGEKRVSDASPDVDPEYHDTMSTGQNSLHRDLQGRHMQMIAMYVGHRVPKCILTPAF